jgi:hypothetical protein
MTNLTVAVHITNMPEKIKFNDSNIKIYKYTQDHILLVVLRLLNFDLFNVCMQRDDGFNASY